MNLNKQTGYPYPVFTSTMTFSSKNTQNNSTCAQSFLVEALANTHPIVTSPQTPNKPEKFMPPHSRSSRNSTIPQSQGLRFQETNNFFRYKEIERILKQENDNLKNQNNLMLFEINKLRETNSKYKKIDRLQKLQIEHLRQECEAQKNRAEELKQIVMSRMAALEERVKGSSFSDKNSVLAQMLQFSQEFQE